MNNESCLWDAMSKIFSGKGGSIRSAIAAVIILGVVGEIIYNGYALEGETKDGCKLAVKPADVNGSVKGESLEASEKKEMSHAEVKSEESNN